jgi:hypothetical protein
MIPRSRSVGVAAEALDTTHEEAYSFLRNSGPALIQLNSQDWPMFLAVIGRRRKALQVLSPPLRIVQIPITAISAELCRELEPLPLKIASSKALTAACAMTGVNVNVFFL